MGHTLLRLLALAMVALVSTCAAPQPGDAGPDGAADAGRDVGPGADARPDAFVRDAHVDDARDVGTDGDLDGGPTDPTWVRMTSMPDTCDMEVAMHPERLGVLVWRAECGPGCLMPNGAVDSGYVDGDGTRYFGVGALVGGRQATYLVREDGTGVAAWIDSDDRPGSSCGIIPFAVGGGRVGVAAYATISAHPELDVNAIWIATIGDNPSLVDPALILPNRTNLSIERLFLSATHFAYQSSPDGTLYLSDGTDRGQIMQVASTDGIPQGVDLRGDHVVYENWQADHIRLATGSYGTTTTTLYGADPGDVQLFATDGVDLAWLNGFGYDGSTLTYATLELWTAPYTTSATTLAPRRISVVTRGTSRSVVGGGWFVTITMDGGFDAWSLADGSRRHWTPPVGTHVLTPSLYYATANDVAFYTNHGTRRIDPTTLPVLP